MELPKNITQVGETDRSCKIYVEDYVVSYIKQMNRFAQDKEIALAVYGKGSREDNLTYYFIYGACKLDFLQREVRHLSQAQTQEIEKLRIKYFPDYENVGYLVLNGEMVEGFYIREQNTCRYVNGYACFYEKNDCMLAYMLDNQSSEFQAEQISVEKYDMVRRRQEERRQQYEEQMGGGNRKEADYEKGDRKENVNHQLRRMKLAAAGLFLILCFLGYSTFQEEEVTNIKTNLQKAFASLTEQKLSGEEIEDVNSETNRLVAEDSLTDAIRQENNLYAKLDEEIEPTEEVFEPTENSEENVENVMQGIVDESLLEGEQKETEPEEDKTDVEDGMIATPQPQEPEMQDQEVIQTNTESIPQSYVIKKGDTLNEISLKQYGSARYVKQICELNGIRNADNIQVGQKILLP